MRPDSVALLFAPPRPPVRLDPARPAVLGRESRVDVPVSSPEASRRHAEIRFESGGWHLRDLGSKNGTRVNGVPIEGARRLAAGDRISIGAFLVLFTEVPAPIWDAVPAGGSTMTLCIPVEEHDCAGDSATETFGGDLAEIPAYAVIQILELGGQTGELRIGGNRDAGSLWLAGGAPVHAMWGDRAGRAAALALLRADRGRFTFRRGAEAPRRTLAEPASALLLEAARLSDELVEAPDRPTTASRPLAGA